MQPKRKADNPLLTRYLVPRQGETVAMDFQSLLKRIRLGNNNINNKPATITI